MKLFLAVMAVCTFLSTRALADSYTFTLNIDKCTGGCGIAPYGTVTVSDLGLGKVDLDVNVLPNHVLHTGQAGSSVAFNLQSNVNNLKLVSATLPNWSLDSQSAGHLHFDGFGYFEYSLNCCNSQNGASHDQYDSVDIVLSGTGLTANSFAQQLSSGGSTNVYFAVDILSQSTGRTGAVGASSFSQVPDGGVTLMLLGGALVGLETLRRKSRA
jgi:hypothetical protein